MENASKALIIAGAILLSILIIALGMTVYNSSSSVTGSIGMDAQEISSFNSKFLAYQGKQKSQQVASLLTLIQNNNNEYDDRLITIRYSNSTTKVPQNPSCKDDALQSANKANAGIAIVISPNSYDWKAMTNLDGYNANLKAIRTSVNSNTTTFNVSFIYNDSGLIKACDIYVAE